MKKERKNTIPESPTHHGLPGEVPRKGMKAGPRTTDHGPRTTNIYPSGSVILAPLSGFTDLPYRRSARRFGAKFAFTEMVDAGSLVFGNEKTIRFLSRGEDEDWLGVQLVGAETEILTKAVKIVNQHDFSVLDFNLGCPAPKVVKKGEGAALGKNIDKAVETLEILVRNSQIPVTAKIRILCENDPAPTIELCKKLESVGAQVITVHGRIQSAFYSGPVFVDIIKAVCQNLHIQVVANGGVMGYKSYSEIRQKTGCQVVMAARGAMGNPWLFSELADPENFQHPNITEFADEMEAHINEMVDFYGEELGLRIARKIILDYLRGRGFPGTLKCRVSKMVKIKDFTEFMKEVRQGPSQRFWSWLRGNPEADRKLRKD